MKKIFFSFVAVVVSVLSINAQIMPDAPFGWAVSSSLTSGDSYNLTGGGNGKAVVLKSNGLDMRKDVIRCIETYDILVFDGSGGPFIISATINLKKVKGKTFLGINGACLKTRFEVTPELTKLLDDAGVKEISSKGGGGTLSNGIQISEKRETYTRQTIIDNTGDETEAYRHSGIFSLSACENLIFRNLAFEGPGPIDVGGSDLLAISNESSHVWVDHCSFTDGMDGNFDINSRADFITVSWCTFQYTDKAYDHRLSNLVGSNSSPSQGVDNLNVTYAYCVWGTGCYGRMPMVRHGNIHLLNNYYNCPGNSSAINPCTGAEILVEGCYFREGMNKVFRDSDAKAYTFKDNIFKVDFIPSDKGDLTPFPYKYTSVKASEVPVLTKQSGPTLKLSAPEGAVQHSACSQGSIL